MSENPNTSRYLYQPRPRIIRNDGGVFVPLTRGYHAQIDEADVPMTERHAWSAMITKRGVYAGRRENRKWVLLHREIMNAQTGWDIDHRDGNTLDCRRHNLRPATRSQNTHNSNAVIGAIPLRGVWFDRHKGKYRSEIRLNGVRVVVGSFSTPEEASAAYEAKRRALIGEFYPIR
jgi:hypothetical protein